jgi:CII-binding regulator of phage lambda lysogenization HflD
MENRALDRFFQELVPKLTEFWNKLKYQSRYTTKANMSIYRLMVIALEAELQNVLYNLKYSKLDKAVKDIKTMTAKYQKIATDGNQNIAPTITKFIGEIEYLFIEAIKIEYEYYIQKERIREEQRAIREQMRQEAAERKRLEEERKKVEAEEEKYKNEISSIQNKLSEAKDQALIKQLEERIAKIQSQLTEVEKKKEDIVKLEHGQAGHIYVISNLGSFGENVFKIGMTRRLDPQERIDELGDASVPFRFDVHSKIFSNTATELEAQLHKKLHNNRVNKINLRKEFFRTTIDELEELVYSLDPSAQFDRTMMAEQYYQSMAVNEVPESVKILDDDTIDDDDELE